jgi:hypothetical protein
VAAPAFGGSFAGGAPMAAAPAPAAGAAPAAAPAEEKTEFSVKLDGFADGEKIKVRGECVGLWICRRGCLWEGEKTQPGSPHASLSFTPHAHTPILFYSLGHQGGPCRDGAGLEGGQGAGEFF